MNPTTLARIGAACYFVWGLLHLDAAYNVFQVGFAMPGGPEGGRVLQDAWYILFSALAAMGLATLNWRNHTWGYWINLGVISVADVGFIVFLLWPGWLPLWPALLGPILWILGAVFTTLALVRRPEGTAS